MRKLEKIMVAAICSLSCIFYPLAAHAKPLITITAHHLIPHTWFENGAAKGIDPDIIRELFRRMGMENTYQIKEYPFKRSHLELKRGHSDMAFTAFKTPEREEYAYYPEEPLGWVPFSLFVTQDNIFTYNEIDDLEGKIVGIGRGYSAGPVFDAARENELFTVAEISSDSKMIEMLVRGRVDVVVQNYYTASYHVKALALEEQLVCLPNPIQDLIPYYLIVSKASKLNDKPELVKKIAQTLKEMRQDGTIDNIIAEYVDNWITH